MYIVPVRSKQKRYSTAMIRQFHQQKGGFGAIPNSSG